MAVRIKINPLNLNYNLMLSATLSPQDQSRIFAEYAGRVIEDAKAHNAKVLGRVPPHTIAVDGRIGAPLASVRPGGTIFAEFELVFDALDWIGNKLREFSPVKSGRYRKSHVLLADSIAVEDGAIPPAASRYTFVSVVPYARKIERGQSPQRPDGVYQAVAVLASRKFGNVARIKFGYETPLFGEIDRWAGSSAGEAWARKKRKGSSKGHAEWLRRQPAVVITL